MKPDQRMGAGNYAIAGHYMDKKDVLFGGLVDVKKGDIMRVTDKSTIYEYKVVALEKVPDSKLEMISNKRAEKYGKPIMSLMTCYYNETSYRYFVIGELERSYKYRTDDMIRGL